MNRRLQYWTFLVVAVVLGLAALLAAIGALTEHHFSRGDSRGGQLGGAAIIAVFAVLAAHRALRMRRLLRAGTLPPTLYARVRRVWASPAGRPWRLGAAVVLLTGTAAFFAIHAVNDLSHWRTSRYTQAHGIRTTASIDGSSSVQQCGRYGCYAAGTMVRATLFVPIDGQARTTIHVPQVWNPKVGDYTHVIVDPHDIGYSEVPGHPYTTLFSVITMGLLGILLVATWVWLMVVLGLRLVRRQPLWRPPRS